MKTEKLSKKQKEDLEKFGANSWFVESIHDQYEKSPKMFLNNGKTFLEIQKMEAHKVI